MRYAETAAAFKSRAALLIFSGVYIIMNVTFAENGFGHFTENAYPGGARVRFPRGGPLFPFPFGTAAPRAPPIFPALRSISDRQAAARGGKVIF